LQAAKFLFDKRLQRKHPWQALQLFAMLFCWRNLLALSLSLGPVGYSWTGLFRFARSSKLTSLQLALGLTTSQQSQLKLEPSHLPDAKDLEHIQLELG